MIRFQISKQTIVTGGKVVAACRVVLVYKVMNSQLGNCKLWTALQR